MFLASLVTLGASWIVFPFIYNKLYIKELIKEGFKAKEIVGSDIKILEAKLGFPLPQQ